MTHTDIFAVIVKCLDTTKHGSKLSVVWHFFYVWFPTSFTFHCVKASCPEAKQAAAFIYYFDSVMRGRMWSRQVVANEMFDPWAATYCHCVFANWILSLVLQPPRHFSITQNVPSLISARFLIDTACTQTQIINSASWKLSTGTSTAEFKSVKLCTEKRWHRFWQASCSTGG